MSETPRGAIGRVLLVGTGYVGTVLARRLLDAGATVLGLRRSERALPAGVEAYRGDVISGEGLNSLPEVEQLVYAVSPGERSASAYQDVYQRGLLRVAERFPNARVLLVSSSAVYGSATAHPVSESTETEPDDETSRELAAGERALLALRPQSVVLRASGIYGPGRTSLLARLARERLGDEEREQVTNRIHRDDLAACLEFFLRRRDLTGLFNATDSFPSTWGEMQDWLLARPVPAWLESAPARPSRERRRVGRALSNEKLLGTGFSLAYPSFREGYAAILAQPAPTGG
ncbi:MAG TPA: NAD-dependent epimerase/dehydratase family protein [Polyangiaceae bacterium]|nr:NAD-dependent epimerase/dehydratase family protein [Polyangiaceae bacterium]